MTYYSKRHIHHLHPGFFFQFDDESSVYKQKLVDTIVSDSLRTGVISTTTPNGGYRPYSELKNTTDDDDVLPTASFNCAFRLCDFVVFILRLWFLVNPTVEC